METIRVEGYSHGKNLTRAMGRGFPDINDFFSAALPGDTYRVKSQSGWETGCKDHSHQVILLTETPKCLRRGGPVSTALWELTGVLQPPEELW